ncbi:MAG: transposase [Candidatus Kerfeldbacteria bacterium]|nr:transposase [Candidatus Kerfeldbacteria bacterium]
MPSQYRIRTFIQDGYYHVFNRGTAKGEIYKDQNDYEIFIHLLRTAVLPASESIQRKNFYQKIRIISFCLMPNHFHIELQQTNEDTLPKFMSSLTVAYSMFFNRKYHRTSALFQGKYQSTNIDSDTYLLHLSRYIHLNPHSLGVNPFRYRYSSIEAYTSYKHPWIYTQPIDELLDITSQKQREDWYKSFLLSVDDFGSLEKQDPFL